MVLIEEPTTHVVGSSLSWRIGHTCNVHVFSQTRLGADRCGPSYADFYLPQIEVTGELGCDQVTYRPFIVVPADPHQFDSEGDGIGCESD